MNPSPLPRRVTAAVLSLLLAACAGGGPDPEPGAGTVTPGEELASTLLVRLEDDAVRLILQVTNATGDSIPLEFTSGQRFDFVVQDAGGQEVWRWSEGRGFTQALGTEHLPPGETLRYDAVWDPEGREGQFQAVGYLPARERIVRRSVPFTLPAP